MPEITKICHGLTIGDLKFGNARPGIVEATLKPGETMEQALDELDERLNAWHRKRYPHLYQDSAAIPFVHTNHAHKDVFLPEVTTYHSGALPIISKDNEKIEIEIDNAETIEDLKKVKAFYEFLPASLINHYYKRMTELTTGRPKNFTDGL